MSDFFEEYLKIAEQHGLISKEDYIDPIENIKKAETARNESIAEQIALLYGVKPNGKEDDKSITERAHPETAVVFPAEDRMNGIVENDQERQDIMTQIALRPNNNKYQQRAFVTAYQDLLTSLSKTANDLDLNGHEDLAVFADDCSQKLVKESNTLLKEAMGPLVVPGLVIGAVVLAVGSIAAINYSSFAAQNVSKNSDLAIEELEDLRDVFGHDIINDIVRNLYDLKLYAEKFASLPKIKAISPEELLQIETKYKTELQVADSYRKVLIQTQRNIPTYISQLQNAESAGGESDWWHKVQYIAKLFTPDDRQDAVNALEGLMGAVTNAIKSVDYYQKSAEKYEPSIKQVFENSMGPVSQMVKPEDDKAPSSITDIM